jgi:hypothetical protein
MLVTPAGAATSTIVWSYAPADAARPAVRRPLPRRGGALRPAGPRGPRGPPTDASRRFGPHRESDPPARTARSGSSPQADGAGTFALYTLVLERRPRPRRFRYEDIRHPPATRRSWISSRSRVGYQPTTPVPWPHAANARHPGARGRRLHGRAASDCHRPTGPRVGRGVVRGVRLARVRSNAGPGDALRLHARVGLR